MQGHIADPSPRAVARIAGILYVAYIAASVVADLFGRFAFAEPAETVNRMLSHESLFRIGFLISQFSSALFLLAAWALYVLLKPVNKNLALLFLLLNACGFVIYNLGTLNLLASLSFVGNEDYLKVFPPEQLMAQARIFIGMRKSAIMLAQIPYGVWLLPLGYLVLKSRMLPKVIGILLIADGFGLLISVAQHFSLPGLKAISYPSMALGFLAEVSLSLWLAILSVKSPK